MQNSDDVYRGHVTHPATLFIQSVQDAVARFEQQGSQSAHRVNWSRDPAGCFIYNIKLLFAVFF